MKVMVLLFILFSRESFSARIAVVDTNFDPQSKLLFNNIYYSFNHSTQGDDIFYDPGFRTEDLRLFEKYFLISSIRDKEEELSTQDLHFLEKIESSSEHVSLLSRFVDFSHGTHVASLAIKESLHDLVLVKFDLFSVYFRPDNDHEERILKSAIDPKLKTKKYIESRFHFLYELGDVIRQQKSQVANFSWGLNYFSLREIFCDIKNSKLGLCGYYQQELKTYLDNFFQHFHDLYFVIAAGNENTDLEAYPSLFSMNSYPNVIQVGALNHKKEKASFSNYGEGIDIYCPGVAIESVVYGDKILPISGTSMAAPIAANIVGSLLDLNKISKEKMIERIVSQSSCLIP